MASLCPSRRFVSGEIIMAMLWAALLLMACPVCDWSPLLPNANAREVLWVPHHDLPLPANGLWAVQGRCAVLSVAADLALEEGRNCSFILIVSDFVLLLKDACRRQTQRLNPGFGGEGSKQASKHLELPKWVGSVAEWKPRRKQHSDSHVNSMFRVVFWILPVLRCQYRVRNL